MRPPKEITSSVLKFTGAIAPSQHPVYIDCEPLRGKPALECFPVVDEHIEAYGGTRELGWCIYEWPEVMIEAELHAIWIDPSGKRRDIAPHQLRMHRILFLPDPAARYGEVHVVNNHRLSLSDDPMIAEYIQLSDQIYEEENRGELATQPIFIATEEWREMQLRRASIESQLVQRYGFRPGTPILWKLLHYILRKKLSGGR